MISFSPLNTAELACSALAVVCWLTSIVTGNRSLNVTIAGAALLTLLFQGSTAFTERLSLDKSPSYAAYQRTTSRLLPWPPRG